MTDTESKNIILLGTIEGKNAVVTLEKLPFDLNPSILSDFKSLGIQDVKLLDVNDVYSWNLATLIQDLDSHPSAKINIIYPATDTHIKKYEKSKPRYIVETPELYQKYVVPYIETMRGDRIKWVRQILHEGVEADRVLVRIDKDPTGKGGEFLLLPDLKWDRKTLETLYLVAILIPDNIASIRDLNSSHIPMLESIRDQILKTVKNEFGLTRSQLKLYVHCKYSLIYIYYIYILFFFL